MVAGLRLLAIDPIVPAAASDRRDGPALAGRDPPGNGAQHHGALGALITYDNRMIREGQAIGLPVLSPA